MSKFNKKNNEEVPKDYFVKFGEKMLDRTLEEELFDKEDFPLLNSIEKNNDFTVPSQYLENFELAQKISKPKSFTLYRALGIAASLLLAAFLFTLSIKNDDVIEKQIIASQEELDFYLEDSEELEISDILELQELIEDKTGTEILLEDLDNDILIDYLLDESDPYDLVAIY